MGILGDVKAIFKNMGLGCLPFEKEDSRQDETCEFLASLELHLKSTPSDATDLGHITFSTLEENYAVSLHDLALTFGFQEGVEDSFDNTLFTNLDDVWRSISGKSYTAGVSKASTIRHPAIRYVHKFLAHTFFCRKEATTVKDKEMIMLAMGIKPLLKKCLNNKKVEGDGSDVNIAVILVKRLMQLKDEALRTGRNRLTQLSVGGIVTMIFRDHGVRRRCGIDARSQVINAEALATSWYLGGKIGESYVYRFQLREEPAKILLPNVENTDMTNMKNVLFLPPAEALFNGGAVPTPFWRINKDQAKGKDTAGPSTSLVTRAEEADDDDPVDGAARYDFTPYSEPLASKPMREAHRHISLLQRFNRYQERSIQTMASEISTLKQEVKELKQKAGCQAEANNANAPKKVSRKRKANRTQKASKPGTSYSSSDV